MGRYKKRELLYTGVDYIRAFINIPEENILRRLSVNSNQIFLEFMEKNISVVKKNISDKYPFYFEISFESINVWFIGFWGKNRDFIEITGQGLTIFWVDIFYFLMKEFFLEFVQFKRVDLCFDMELDINYFYDTILWDEFKENKTNCVPFKTQKNWIETLYFWQKNIKKNSYLLNRIYNKLLDSKNKQKLFLYDEYKNEDGTYKNVTRFESEIREDLCKFYKFEVLKDSKFIFYRLVKSFFKYNVQFFKFLKENDFEKFSEKMKKRNKLNLQNIKNGTALKANSLYQERILKIVEEKKQFDKYWQYFLSDEDRISASTMFISYAKKLYKNGFSIEKLQEMIKINCE